MNLIDGDYRPDIRTVKSRLLKEFGDDVLIVERANKSTIVCFRNTGYKILTDTWYVEKKIKSCGRTNENRSRRSQVFKIKQYPTSEDEDDQIKSINIFLSLQMPDDDDMMIMITLKDKSKILNRNS
jgi:hypothetical protein